MLIINMDKINVYDEIVIKNLKNRKDGKNQLHIVFDALT